MATPIEDIRDKTESVLDSVVEAKEMLERDEIQPTKEHCLSLCRSLIGACKSILDLSRACGALERRLRDE